MNDIFHISKLLIKKRLKILSASDELELKKFNEEYPFTEEIKIDELVDKIDDYSTINKEKAWESIENKSQSRKEKPVFIIFNKNWYKYAAAAIIVGILATTYILKNDLFNSPVEPTPVIVNNNSTSIEPGTDKATLTLEDGSIVTLEKGDTYQTQNANSNGEEIVYDTSKSDTKEIAYNYLTIPRGGQFHVILSDGTEVWLNSESQLKYPVNFVDGETRTVELVYGEAYFDVSPSTKHKGAKFQVHNNSQLVEVIGTEFNIKAYKDETNIYTTLVDGKVAISSGGIKEKLVPNQQSNLDLSNNHISISKVDVYSEISWKNGVFIFKQKPLKDIMKVLSRWYDIDVVFKNEQIENEEFIGSLGKNQNIEEVLKSIKYFGIINNYTINGKNIILE